jgi:hypothetical protein
MLLYCVQQQVHSSIWEQHAASVIRMKICFRMLKVIWRRKCVNYVQQLQWLWQIKAIKLWMASLILQNPVTNYVLILYNFYLILLTVWHTINLISDFKNNKIWIQYFGSNSTHCTFFKNKNSKEKNNSNVIFLQCILLSSFTTQFHWYLERFSIIILHRCHLLHLRMLVSSTTFVQNREGRCKTLLLICFVEKLFYKHTSRSFIHTISCLQCV